MDPISALNVAAATVQFLEFTTKIASSTGRIYRHGSTGSTQCENIRAIVESLTKLNDELRHQLDTPDCSMPSSSSEDIVDLGKKCNVIGAHLISVLNKVESQAEHTLWTSFRTALRCVLKESEIDSLFENLKDYRTQIATLLLVSIRTEILSTETARKRDYTELRRLCQKVLTKVDHNASWQVDIIAAIRRSHEQSSNFKSGVIQSQDPHEPLFLSNDRFLRSLIKTKLAFQDIDRRYEQIPAAFAGTFEWIFKVPGLPSKWDNFLDWIKCSQSWLYWMTGKPGAGKSTLMKFAFDHSRTQKALQDLAAADGMSLITASFFFWNSGTSIQMSAEGLLRALIHQILSARPELIDELYQQQIEVATILGSQTLDDERWDWKWSELLKDFQRLIRMASKKNKVVLFIDGLDEFEGEPAQLIKIVTSLHVPNVKVCVASRPWIQFEDAFMSHSHLRLEQLTYRDIKKFVTSNFHANPGFAMYQLTDADAVAQLIVNICEKASGVFLWVDLVVRSLVEGLTEGDHISELQERLDELPADLEQLFEKLLSGLSPPQFARASQLLQLFDARPCDVSLLLLAFADDEDPYFMLKFERNAFKGLQGSARCELMRRRLSACCRGLLEVRSGTGFPGRLDAGDFSNVRDSIEYLHRTVRDYVKQPEVWTKICLAAPPSFDLNLRLYNLLMGHLKLADATILHKGGKMNEMITITARLALDAKPIRTDWNMRLLHQLDSNLLDRYTDLNSFIQPDIFVKHQLTLCVERSLTALSKAQRSSTATRFLNVAISRQSTFASLTGGIRTQRYDRNIVLIELLFRHGADPNSCWDRTLMNLAQAHDKDVNTIATFLRHGADPKNNNLKSWLRDDKTGTLSMLIKEKRKGSGWMGLFK